MKYRSRAEIMVEILRSALEASTKTTIMKRSSITHPQLEEYLTLLMESGLLECISETELYRITPRGVYLISVYEQMENESRLRSVVI